MFDTLLLYPSYTALAWAGKPANQSIGSLCFTPNRFHLPQRKTFMSDLSSFEITKKWPAKNPGTIQLYSLPTPNGIKVSAMLEETGLPYEAHLVDFGTNDQMSAEFLSLNPNNKIPAIIDPDGPGGKPLGLWETGAILIYLAEKTGKFLPADPARKYETVQWLMWQMGGFGPMAGQLGFFHKFAGKDYEDRRPFERYRDETKRLLGVLNARLERQEFIMGADYTIADMASWPWARTITGFYEASEEVGIENFPEVVRWLEVCAARPASQTAVNIPPRG
jgi:GSH-dependent disulfide-bond oxidoreductase